MPGLPWHHGSALIVRAALIAGHARHAGRSGAGLVLIALTRITLGRITLARIALLWIPLCRVTLCRITLARVPLGRNASRVVRLLGAREILLGAGVVLLAKVLLARVVLGGVVLAGSGRGFAGHVGLAGSAASSVLTGPGPCAGADSRRSAGP